MKAARLHVSMLACLRVSTLNTLQITFYLLTHHVSQVGSRKPSVKYQMSNIKYQM